MKGQTLRGSQSPRDRPPGLTAGLQDSLLETDILGLLCPVLHGLILCKVDSSLEQ